MWCVRVLGASCLAFVLARKGYWRSSRKRLIRIRCCAHDCYLGVIDLKLLREYRKKKRSQYCAILFRENSFLDRIYLNKLCCRTHFLFEVFQQGSVFAVANILVIPDCSSDILAAFASKFSLVNKMKRKENCVSY